jgi:flagellar motor switch protein FliG
MDFDSFTGNLPTSPLSKPEKAAAVLLAMGTGVAGKLLKYFTQAELQTIIASAQALRAIPPSELTDLVNEFEDLFTEGTGLMDNAIAMERILDEGLTPEEVDSLLGRRTAFQAYQDSDWDRLQEADPAFICTYLSKEHPQTIAYILSNVPSAFGAKILMELPEKLRADIMKRAVNLKNVNPKAVQIIEKRISELVNEIEAEKNSTGPVKVADLMNQLEKPQVDSLLGSLEEVSQEAALKVRPKIFLFEDILSMPQRSRVALLNDIAGDIITMALKGSPMPLREAVLGCLSPRQRRMVEADLGAGAAINPREVALARRAISQEAIRLANAGQIELKAKEEPANEAA